MKLYKLEALRGLAALYVVLHHTVAEKSLSAFGVKLGFLLRFGQEAVILFFIISGFVINYSFSKSSDKSFYAYFSKRALRIYIPLACVFILSYLIKSLSNLTWVDPDVKTLTYNIFMLQDWELVKPNVIASTYMDNTPLWSLSYEWWFYMAYFPLATFIKSNNIRHVTVYTIAVCSAFAYLYTPSFLPRIGMYGAIWWTGVFLADLYLDNKNINIKTVFPAIVGLALPTLVLLVPVIISMSNGSDLLLGMHPLLEFRHFSFALVATTLAIIWRYFSWKYFDLLVKPFALIAPISYTVYISHHPIMVGTGNISNIDNPMIDWIIGITAVIIFSWCVEIVLYRKIRLHFLKHPSNTQ